MNTSPDDPFGEHARPRLRARLSVLGGDFAVTSTDAQLLQLAIDAFGRSTKHRFDGSAPRFKIHLVLADHRGTWARRATPPQPVFSSGAELLCATVDAGNFAIIDARMSRALVSISRAMLRRPYYARYELIELAFLTLASRVQSLVPLHAACVGVKDRCVLLMGASGSGKSTLTLHAFAKGIQLLSEDSAFVSVDSLRVTGVPNFLYINRNARLWLPPGDLRRAIESSPIIRRRSGTRKYEVDVSHLDGPIARRPLRLAGTVFLSPRPAGCGQELKLLEARRCLSRLRREQPYASSQPGWRRFERRVIEVPAFELRRTHPDNAVRQLRTLLE
jgi:hypothetical protein